jgi:uncharacterized MAPEG superfamily protein
LTLVTSAASTEIAVLGWSALLLVVQIFAQATAAADRGQTYLLSARDETRGSRSAIAGRLDRALRNLLETYPAFIALSVALVLTGKTGGVGAAGALVWIIARVVYVPVYAAGISVIRSLIWFASIIGLAMMFVRLMF